MPKKKEKAYAKAGVDIALAEKLLDKVKPDLKKASRPESLGSIGGFGGFFDISKIKLKHPILVSSTDSVGTKVTAAKLANNFKNLGADIVNHCANDVAVCGAEPLYFLDYYATGKLNNHYIDLLRSLAKAAQAGNIAIVGGETAELPGVYQDGECDLVGTIVGVVDKAKILTGDAIRKGDVLIGLSSSGLHTNGYSLARKVLFETLNLKPTDCLPKTKTKVATALLAPHVNYAPFLQKILKLVNKGNRAATRKDNQLFGAAHITGGGFTGNIPRILPKNVDAVINTAAWKPSALFQTIVDGGGIDFEEAYEVFNMGIGMVLAVSPEAVSKITKLATEFGHKPKLIGEVIKGTGKVQLTIH